MISHTGLHTKHTSSQTWPYRVWPIYKIWMTQFHNISSRCDWQQMLWQLASARRLSRVSDRLTLRSWYMQPCTVLLTWASIVSSLSMKTLRSRTFTIGVTDCPQIIRASSSTLESWRRVPMQPSVVPSSVPFCTFFAVLCLKWFFQCSCRENIAKLVLKYFFYLFIFINFKLILK